MLFEILIALVGGGAILLSQLNNYHYRKYACLLGMLTHILWFILAYDENHLYYIYIRAALFLAWSVGIYTYWIKPIKLEKIRQTRVDEASQSLKS